MHWWAYCPVRMLRIGCANCHCINSGRAMANPLDNLKSWKPGQSGNPAGRAKGSRNKLGEAFIEAMHADFMEHGTQVIETVRVEKPDQYLKVIASILP